MLMKINPIVSEALRQCKLRVMASANIRSCTVMVITIHLAFRRARLNRCLLDFVCRLTPTVNEK